MLHGTVFSKRVPLAAGDQNGKKYFTYCNGCDHCGLFTRYWRLKKSNYLRLEVLGTLFAYLLIFIIIGIGFFVFTNGYLDSSPGIKQVVYITDKKAAGKGYFIYFQLDDKDKKEIDIEVSEFFYKSVKTGDPLIITYKQGYHHIRWLVSYEKGNP